MGRFGEEGGEVEGQRVWGAEGKGRRRTRLGSGQGGGDCHHCHVAAGIGGRVSDKLRRRGQR